MWLTRARVGVVTGPKAVLDRINLHMQASVMHTSGLAQVGLNPLLQCMWSFKFCPQSCSRVYELLILPRHLQELPLLFFTFQLHIFHAHTQRLTGLTSFLCSPKGLDTQSSFLARLESTVLSLDGTWDPHSVEHSPSHAGWELTPWWQPLGGLIF